MLGRVQPRVFTPARAEVQHLDNSWGHDFIAFCDLIGYPLDEWQAWLAIHLGELNQDGSPRYRKAIIIVARQNGKSMLAVLLTLYWMFIERVPLVYGTHTSRGEAKKAWNEVIQLARENDILKNTLPPRHVALQIGEEDFWNQYGAHYTFGAANRRAGRGRTIHRVLLDELREHRDRDCWNAIVPATNAVENALVLCISNEGPEDSVVLHEEYDAALNFIETGQGDARTFLAAWSSPSDADPMDLNALAWANPSLNRIRANGTGLREDSLLSLAHTAVSAGGKTLADFKTEMMCIRVDQLDAAIRPEDWAACGQGVVDLAQHRRTVALCFDVAMDHSHATAVAAVVVDGVVHVEPVASWDGYEARRELRAALPELVARIKPRKVTWFAGGPAAAVADAWGSRLGGVRLEPIRAEDVVRACMGMEEMVAAGDFRHAHDPLLDLQVKQAQRLPQGDGWRFMRRGQSPIDSVYAAAGAAHSARTMPASVPFASA